MGWFDDLVEDVGNAFEDAGEAIGNAVEDAVDFVGDAAETVADVATDVAEGVAQVVTGTVESVIDLGETIGDIVTGEEGIEELGNWLGESADRMIFDPIDTATGGVIDIDYEEGSFSAGVDIGIASAGIALGESGFDTHAEFDLGVAAASLSYSDDAGFSASASLGVDFLPLPYLEGHVDISPDGDVSIGGEVQANLPGLELGASGDFVRDSDGSWTLGGEVWAEDDLPFIDLEAHAGAAVGQNDDGDLFVHAEGGASAEGPLGLHASAEGSVDVVRSDGETLIDVFGEAEAGIGSHEVGVEGGTHVEVSDQDVVDGVQDVVDGVQDLVMDIGAAAAFEVNNLGQMANQGTGALSNVAADLANAGDGIVANVSGASGTGTDAGADQSGSSDAPLGDAPPEIEPEIEPVIEPVIEPTVEVEPTAPEAPVDDFQQEIAAADAAADSAGDVWDDLDG